MDKRILKNVLSSFHQTPDIGIFYLAYRKVKAELWWAKNVPCREDLLAFEKTPEILHKNLYYLRSKIENFKECDSTFSEHFNSDDNRDFLGRVYRLPKSLNRKGVKPSKSHFENLTEIHLRDYDRDDFDVEIRHMARPSIEFQILGVLWAMDRGATLDSVRSDNSRGYALKRENEDALPRDDEKDASRNTNGEDCGFLESGKGPISSTYPGLYQPYFKAYQRWRSDGLKACRVSLKNGKRVFAISMDIQRFYHRIDAHCLKDLYQHEPIGSVAEAFHSALEAWQDEKGETLKDTNTKLGIPVGLIASGLVANLVLNQLDKAIEEAITPVYYGRYVDDLFLVLELAGEFKDSESVYDRIGSLLKLNCKEHDVSLNTRDEGNYEFNSEKWGNSSFRLKLEKQKCFLLEGDRGEDLLKVIDQDLKNNSSEWRMVPDLEDSDEILMKETLSVGDDGSAEVITLRDADSLSLRRMGISINLRRLELMERFQLKTSEWEAYRTNYYRFSIDHILTEEGLTDYLAEIPRIFGLAFAHSDWRDAARMLKKLSKSIVILDRISPISTTSAESTDIADFLCQKIGEQFLSSGPKNPNSRIASDLISKIQKISCFGYIENLSSDNIEEAIKLYSKHDLGRHSAGIDLMRGQNELSNAISEATDYLDNWAQDLSSGIDGFPKNPDALVLLFPTRPLDALEISLLQADTPLDLADIKMFLHVSRGYNYPKEEKDDAKAEATNSNNEETALYSSSPVIKLASDNVSNPVRIAVTNYKTKLESWDKSVRRKPDHSLNRLHQLLSLVDSFLRKTKDESWDEKPLYFVLPELSIPTSWLYPLAKIFGNNGISLLVGGEYEHLRNGKVENPAYLFLRTTELGYPTTVAIKQVKTEAAQGEAKELWEINHSQIQKKSEDEIQKTLPVYQHGDFHFGVVLCSELSNSQLHHRFRGFVDAIFCLEWNPDIETYSALVESSAYSIHAYMIQVNNRKYGDSRIRAPAKERYHRDIVRLQGGSHDYYVVGEVDIKALRDFQRNLHSDQSEKAKYKPTPSGFNPKLYTQRLGASKPD